MAGLLIVVYGLIAGSFLGLCAYRLPRGLSVVKPGSRCPACEHALPWFENLPVFSFLWLHGRCRHCAASVAWRYPAIELLTAVAFSLAWWRSPTPLAFFRLTVFLASMVLLAATDFETQLLPDEITLGGWLTALVLAAAAGRIPAPSGPSLTQATTASFGGAVFLALFALTYQFLRRRAGLGWGDVKMVGMIGAFLGFWGMLATLLLGSIVAALVGLFQMAWVFLGRRRRGRSWRQARASAFVFLSRAALPLGVFLAAAGALTALWATWPLAI